MSLFETAVPAMRRVAELAFRRFSPGDPEILRRGGVKYAELTPIPESEAVLTDSVRELIESNLERAVSKEITLLYGSAYEVTTSARIIEKTHKGPQLELTVSVYEPGRRP